MLYIIKNNFVVIFMEVKYVALSDFSTTLMMK